MGSVVANLGAGISKQLGSFVDLPKITVPFTNIVNRAQCVDPSSDLLPRFGVNRVSVQQFEEVQGETGPSGERVFKPINDSFDQVRMYGNWSNENTSHGANVNVSSAPPTTDSMEITFYGTGLNLLIEVDNAGAGRSIKVGVDGGAVGSELFPSTGATPLTNRSYAANNIINVLSGLTLGVHTARVQNGSTRIFGYEVLNTNTTLQYPAGNAYYGSNIYTNTSLLTDGYNSNFASGTLGTTGGHVLVYITQGGSIRKAVTPTATSPSYLSSASHTNESVIRTYHYREFASSRSDDFSTNGGTQSRAFTLDDGTTTLIASQVDIPANVADVVRLGTTNGFLSFTFVGTGVDIIRIDDAGTTVVDGVVVLVDGVNVGSISTTPTPSVFRTDKIASGLPYGTHTVQLVFSGATGTGRTSVRQFITYGPSMPSLPSGAIALADYYLMGNYSIAPNATYGSSGTLSKGTLLKYNTREWVYTGSGPSIGSVQPASFWSGFRVNLNNSGDVAQYVFFGSGCDLYMEGNASGVTGTVAIDGSAPTGTVVGSNLTFVGGNLSWSGATNNIVSITNLSLGLHTVVITHTSSGNTLLIDGIGIITPVHCPKLNTPGLTQNAFAIGSQSIGDQRTFSSTTITSPKSWAVATGVATGSYNLISSVPFPVPDLSCTVKTNGNPIDVSFDISYEFNNTSTADMGFAFYVDGLYTGATYYQDVFSTGAYQRASARRTIPVSAGIHLVQIVFLISGTNSIVTLLQGISRNMTVREI